MFSLCQGNVPSLKSRLRQGVIAQTVNDLGISNESGKGNIGKVAQDMRNICGTMEGMVNRISKRCLKC
jgi:hypothetical protein